MCLSATLVLHSCRQHEETAGMSSSLLALDVASVCQGLVDLSSDFCLEDGAINDKSD